MTRRPPSYVNADDLVEDEVLPLFQGKPVPVPTPFDRGMAGSARAGAKWTPAEVAKVDAAILELARARLPFTTDDVWRAIPYVPVTKGIASRIRRFVTRGILVWTRELAISRRGGKHDHAQTLKKWIGTEKA